MAGVDIREAPVFVPEEWRRSIIVVPLHAHFNTAHLEHVVLEMTRRGPPTIRGYLDGCVWFAREGTHRLRAAARLGVTPIMVCIKWWRTRAALERARWAALERAHRFQ